MLWKRLVYDSIDRQISLSLNDDLVPSLQEGTRCQLWHLRAKCHQFVAMRTTYPLLSLSVSCLLLWSCGAEEKHINPQRQDIVESVYASATVQPEHMYRAFASVTGILEANLVEVGQLVNTGTELLKVTNPAPERNAQNARLQMELAENNYSGENSLLNDLAAQLRTAKLTFTDDSLNFKRQEKLWLQKIGSQSVFEARKLAYERSKNQLERPSGEYRRAEIELRTKLEQARNTYAASMATSDEFTVKSTLNGKVYALFKEPGEVVMPNEPLAMIGSPNVFLLELLVDEVDVVRIARNQEVLISLDAYGDEIFEAKVTKIYPQKDQRSQTFRLEARFKNAPQTLYPGLSGEANIVIDKRSQALTIPRSYLIGEDSVRTSTGMRKVSTGLFTLDRIEITAGLNESDQLLNPAQ